MFNNIVLTPLVFPCQHSCQNLDKVLSVWNSRFNTSQPVKFSKYVALPQLLTHFLEKKKVCMQEITQFIGEAKTGFLPPFVVSPALESEENL